MHPYEAQQAFLQLGEHLLRFDFCQERLQTANQVSQSRGRRFQCF